MIQSSKPRKQRRYRFNAPLHQRQHFLNAHLDKQLRSKMRIGKRAVRVSKGDTIKIMAGKHRGKTGKVTSVSLRRGRITVSALTTKNAKGKEMPVFIRPSNVYITDLNLEDKIRAAQAENRGQNLNARSDRRLKNKQLMCMGGKGNSRYMKRLNAPRYFGVHRKEHAYVTKPNPGRHTLDKCVPLSVAVIKLSLANNNREAFKVIKTGAVMVNSRVIREPKYPIGMEDHISAGRDAQDRHKQAGQDTVQQGLQI